MDWKAKIVLIERITLRLSLILTSLPHHTLGRAAFGSASPALTSTLKEQDPYLAEMDATPAKNLDCPYLNQDKMLPLGFQYSGEGSITSCAETSS